MGYKDALARNLRTCRAALNVTQSKVAGDLDIGQDALSQYENGARTPSFTVVVKLADYYHVSTDYLVGRSNN